MGAGLWSGKCFLLVTFFFIFSFFMVPFVSLEANFIVAIKKLRKFQVFIVKMRLAGGYSMELKGVLT